jgi:spindle assembly abnormal protein 6
MYQHQSSQLEDALKKSSEEINKANEIIRRLQGDVKNAKSKLKLKSLVTVQQEKLLNDQSQCTETLQRQLDQTKHLLKTKEEEAEGLNIQVRQVKELLEESKKTITDNNHGSLYLI